ncbi:predicted protein [Naegleria gruberi]|uniref:Predicted protein n=1 Tax=Naegleria gruberi TaxID=5762 RepID=D2VEX9_NAEGR|nr:uncharacterized protein NAEGRDRAFT_67431 [Naegleria gruberi]EFC44679.1 predicted protein [Naegleria gruberi]|eukprot:XP_002677423.1 predicted protein [Naegleria gruberi strain NEG-M]
MFNGSVVSEFVVNPMVLDESRIIGVSLAVPNIIVERSTIPMRYIVDVMIFNNDNAYDMYYKTNNTNDDLTGFSTSEIFKNAKLDQLDGGLSNIEITSNQELTCVGKDKCIVKVIEFSRLKNTTDVEHDVFLPSKKNERGIMFLNFATWTSSGENVLSNIVFSNMGYGWFEFQSIYYYPVTVTLQGLRITHGILMIIGFSLILVASMLAVRHSARFSAKIKGVATHIVLSIVGVVCIVIAFILSLVACSLTTNRHFDSIHKWIGLFVFLALILYQLMLTGPLTAVFHLFFKKKDSQQVSGNGKSTEQESFLRKSSNFKKISKQISTFFHIWGGRIIVLAGILNLYFGVHGIYATSEWFIGLSVYLLVILCLVIFAELFSGKTFRRILKGKFKKILRSK